MTKNWYTFYVDDEEEYLRGIIREGSSLAEKQPGQHAEKVASKTGG